MYKSLISIIDCIETMQIMKQQFSMLKFESYDMYKLNILVGENV